MLRGDVITSVDGQIVLPSDVAQKLRAGSLGSRVLVKGLRGSSRNEIEATLVRQDAGIVDALVHVEEALTGVRSAATALGGRSASVLEARVAALGRQVVKLSSACAKHETSLSERSAVYLRHIKGLEDAMLRLAHGNTVELDCVANGGRWFCKARTNCGSALSSSSPSSRARLNFPSSLQMSSSSCTRPRSEKCPRPCLTARSARPPGSLRAQVCQ